MKTLLCFAPLLLATPAWADTLSCRADYDEASHYELTASVRNQSIEGPVAFRYVASDDVDLRSELGLRKQALSPSTLTLQAENDSMGVQLGADFDSSTSDFRGTLVVSFTLEHAEPVSVPASCSIH